MTEETSNDLGTAGNLQPSSEQVEAFEEASSVLVASAEQPDFLFEQFTPPVLGTTITSEATGTTYTIGALIGEGSFGYVYEAEDIWGNL